MYKNILLPVTLDHGSDIAKVTALADRLGADDAKVTVISVIETLPIYVSASLPDDYKEQAALKVEAELKRQLEGRGDIDVVVSHGHPAEAILKHAETTKSDCIIVEARRSNVMQDVLLGSIAQRLCRRAKCTVVVAR